MSDERVSHLTAARELLAFRFGAHADVRGWPVFDAETRQVGVVDRIMIETFTGKVRYLAVALARHAAADDQSNAGGSVLVPIGIVRRHDQRKALELRGLRGEDLVRAPRLHARPVNRGDEDATLAAYGLPTSRDVPGGTLYDAPAFDEQALLLAAY